MIRKTTVVSLPALRLAILTALGASLAAPLASAQTGTPADQAELRQLSQQLAELKTAYAQEVRRLRELDMQVQALQARLAGKVPAAVTDSAVAPVAAVPAAPSPATAQPPPTQEGYASTAAEAEQARSEAMSRSVADVKRQTRTLFDQSLVIENSLTYNRYDRKQLTLNGFLALDAIFLGNIAIENVESDTLNYNLAARWGIGPRLSLNMDVPYVARKTVYQKGGAGGAAAAIAQEETTGSGIGDVTLSANYLLLPEQGSRPETVLNFGVTAPTGREPYGIPWTVLERDDDDYVRFAIPDEQPTGNGVWQASIGVSAVKTTDPAILFGNIGYTYSFEASFDDLDTNPDTVNPGDVKLGDSFYYGAGVAFAFNERTSFSMSLSNRLSARAQTRYEGSPWRKVIGSDANAAMFNLGVTHALSPEATIVGILGIGLTPDAPDFSLGFRIPYSL
ncbi:transporter [Pseudoxanthomonas koreensis]|uniref:transporter n=1 Tax=Pseudoxanthomonas koreensis TaxID=266061 RepID=UPI001EE3B419|nr:transporter [Pseudoxanthomonas koreensis]